MSSLTSVHRLALVRADLAHTAGLLNLYCVALVIERAATATEWHSVAHDFDWARTRVHDTDRFMAQGARDAARCLERGDTDGALGALAEECGLTVERWVEIMLETHHEDGTRRARAA